MMLFAKLQFFLFACNLSKIMHKIKEEVFMGDKGLDFKHKEVINICDEKDLGLFKMYVQI